MAAHGPARPAVNTDPPEAGRTSKLAATATYLDIWLMRRVVNYIRVGILQHSYAMFLFAATYADVAPGVGRRSDGEAGEG